MAEQRTLKEEALCLAIESATSTASVALLRAGALLAERRSVAGRHHCETLLPLVDGLLHESGQRLAEVDAFAVSIGPGAFTSLRIGLATLKGLAFGNPHPVAAVSTLRVLALSALAGDRPPDAELIVPVLNAQRGEVYATAYRIAELAADADSAEAVIPESVYDAGELVLALPTGGRLVGEGVPLLESLLDGPAAPGSGARDSSWSAESNGITAPSAACAGRLGWLALGAGRGRQAEELVPRYVRRAEAEVSRDGRRLE